MLGQLEVAGGVGRHPLTHGVLQSPDGLLPALGPIEGDALVPMRKVAVAHAIETHAPVLAGVCTDREVEGLRSLGPAAGVHVLDPLEVGVLPGLAPGGQPGE